jgi:hypothetical protein
MRVTLLAADEDGRALTQAILPVPPVGQTLQWFPAPRASFVRAITITREDELEDESVIARLNRKVERLEAQLDEAAAILRGEQQEYDPFDWEAEA